MRHRPPSLRHALHLRSSATSSSSSKASPPRRHRHLQANATPMPAIAAAAATDRLAYAMPSTCAPQPPLPPPRHRHHHLQANATPMPAIAAAAPVIHAIVLRHPGSLRLASSLPVLLSRGHLTLNGTANAVRQYLWLFEEHNVMEFLILAQDHLYGMDYQKFIQAQRETDADITVVALPMDEQHATAFGLMKIDAEVRIVEFVDKTKGDKLKSMMVHILLGARSCNSCI